MKNYKNLSIKIPTKPQVEISKGEVAKGNKK